MPKKAPEKELIVKRPVKHGAPQKRMAFQGFDKLQPMKYQKKGRKQRELWTHRQTVNWIMEQADPVGFLAKVMMGEEMFPIYEQSEDGTVTELGMIAGDPDLRVMAAKTLLGKCMPDLKAVEMSTTVESSKTIDITLLSNHDLDTIERALEHAVIDGDPSREDAQKPEALPDSGMADN